jgi:hypothetical protein
LSVTDVDAERVFRCAFRLGQVAEEVRTAADRTARCYPDDWHGDAGIAYQMRLDETADRVRRMSVAYDVAASVLMPYARAVLEAQDMWRRSESLIAEAEAAERQANATAAEQGVSRLAGPSPAEGFRAAAYRLQAEAADVEHRAALVCAANLDDEAGRAPAAGTWRKVDRFLGDTAGLLVDTVSGTAALAGMAWHALPGVGSRHSRHEARDDLVAAGKGAVVSIWNLPTDIQNDLDDGRPGLALTATLSVVGPGKLSKVAKASKFATVSKLGKFPLRDVDLAHEIALGQVDLHARLAVHEAWRVSAAEMGVEGADLLNEEKRGGHTLSEHVLVNDRYVWSRVNDGLRVASLFLDSDEAQRAVDLCLKANAAKIYQAYALTGNKKLTLELKMPEGVGLVAKAGADHMVVGRGVRVVLNLEGEEPRVYTAYPIV